MLHLFRTILAGISFGLVFISSCVNSTHATEIETAEVDPSVISWKGKLGGEETLRLSYRVADGTLIGKLSPAPQSDQNSLRVFGEMLNNQAVHLLVFDTSSVVIGMLSGTATGDSLLLSWFSPESSEELPFHLERTVPQPLASHVPVSQSELFGMYSYRFGEEDAFGSLRLTQIDSTKAMLSIDAVGAAPGYPIAEMEKQVVELVGNTVTTELLYSEGCVIRANFYKNMVHVRYQKEACNELTSRATLEGIFVK